jgi:DNA-binding protein H-NS
MAYQSSELAELRAQQEALDKQLAEARERETRFALMEIVQKMRQYGISLGELLGQKGESAPARGHAPAAAATESVAVAPKYRDPVSGATWSGRGRAPAWIAGKDRTEFLIDSHAAGDDSVQATLFPEGH